MTNPLDGLLARLLNDFGSGLKIEDDHVEIKLMGPAGNFMIRLDKPKPSTARRIRQEDIDEYSIPVGIRIINRASGKDVRGFNQRYINAWWLHQFVYEIAAAVAHIEREWDVLAPAYIAKMEDRA